MNVVSLPRKSEDVPAYKYWSGARTDQSNKKIIRYMVLGGK